MFNDSSKEFMGRGFKFPLQLDPSTGNFAMVAYEEDIHEAISLIINTNVGERVMRSDFGSNIKEYVFIDGSLSNLNAIKNNLLSCLNQFEPRIYNTEVLVETSSDKGRLYITINYQVRTTNNQFNVVYPFYVLEGEGA